MTLPSSRFVGGAPRGRGCGHGWGPPGPAPQPPRCRGGLLPPPPLFSLLRNETPRSAHQPSYHQGASLRAEHEPRPLTQRPAEASQGTGALGAPHLPRGAPGVLPSLGDHLQETPSGCSRGSQRRCIAISFLWQPLGTRGARLGRPLQSVSGNCGSARAPAASPGSQAWEPSLLTRRRLQVPFRLKLRQASPRSAGRAHGPAGRLCFKRSAPSLALCKCLN